MLVCMDPSSPPVKRTLHLLKTPDILLANDSGQPGSYSSVNRLALAVASVRSCRLALHWDGPRVAAFRHVQQNVFSGTCFEPSPASCLRSLSPDFPMRRRDGCVHGWI